MENQRKITMALIIAVFISAIEGTVVSTAIPKIVSDLGGLQYIHWAFTAYLLTSTISIPIFGKLADLYGRKSVFIVGVFIFLCGSVLCGLSQGIGQLIFFRALQGLGAGAIGPTTFTIVGDAYPIEKRANIWGLFGTIWGIAGVIGPLLGGFLAEYCTWRWIFFINIPFGLVSAYLIWKLLDERIKNRTDITLDIWGALTFIVSATSLLYAITAGGVTQPWDSSFIRGLLLVSLISFVFFIQIERRAADPIIPMKLFSREIVLSNLAGFMAGAIIIGIDVYLPLWIQGVNGEGPVISGLVLIPMLGGWSFGAIIGGRVLKKSGPRCTVAIGMVMVIIGNAWLLFITKMTPLWVLLIIMSLVGLGVGFLFMTLITVVQSSVSTNLRGTATASYTFLRSLGQMIGLAIYGVIFNNMVKAYMVGEGMVEGKFDGTDYNQLLQNNDLSTPSFQAIHSALEYGIHHLFWGIFVFSILTLLVSIMLPIKIHAKED